MRQLTLPLFVFALLAGAPLGNADDPIEPMAAPPSEGYASEGYSAASDPADLKINGFDQYRRQPDIGGPGSAGYGFKHFSLPFHNYTLWHRPRAATLTRWQRCAPDKFRPRGFGHLFARPCDSFRMEYSPHVMHERDSQYGPSYLVRGADERCPKCGVDCGLNH